MLHLFQIWKGFLSLGVISIWPILEQNTSQKVSLWCIFSLHKEVHHSWSQKLGVISAKADLLQTTKGTEYSSNMKNITHISGSFSRAEYWRLHVVTTLAPPFTWPHVALRHISHTTSHIVVCRYQPPVSLLSAPCLQRDFRTGSYHERLREYPWGESM